MSRLQFITAIPQNIQQGSGCYVGTRTLIGGLRGLGIAVEMVRPQIHLPVFTATRILFNEALRWRNLVSGGLLFALPRNPQGRGFLLLRLPEAFGDIKGIGSAAFMLVLAAAALTLRVMTAAA